MEELRSDNYASKDVMCATSDPGYRMVPLGLDCILDLLYPTMLMELENTKRTLNLFTQTHPYSLFSNAHCVTVQSTIGTV